MKKVLLFGGTSDARPLLGALSRLPCAVTLCVASEYGKALAEGGDTNVTVRAGRLDGAQMARLIRDGSFACVIDATHPYAAEATKNISAAVSETGAPCLRLKREASDLGGTAVVSGVREAVERLRETQGNILLTTGSKELAAYTALPDYDKRLFPRVLPALESLEACLSLGFRPSHIIALQGPMTRDLNAALIRQFDIKTVVTKDGGAAGGFPEKLEAARETGAELIVIGRPDDEGLSPGELLSKLEKILEAGR